VALTENGDLAVEEGRGDFALVSGGKNLGQALKMKFLSIFGELVYHSTYGTKLRELLGERSNLITAAKANIEARRTILSDPRVSEIKSLSVSSNIEPVLAIQTVIAAIGDRGDVPLNIILPKRGIGV
jgi:hypothetical protein